MSTILSPFVQCHMQFGVKTRTSVLCHDLLQNASQFIYYGMNIILGTIVAQWLRCCATNQKVAGLILDGVIGNFH